MSQSSSYSNLSPRQRMINLMYIVLTAMLALNVSSDVLDGFTQVEDGLELTNANIERRNLAIMAELSRAAAQNPEKAGDSYGKALKVSAEAAQLFRLIDSLKLAIVVEADGAGASLDNIQNREGTEPSSVVMLNPVTREGARLRESIADYRELTGSLIPDSIKRTSILAALSTRPFRHKEISAPQLWEESKFENQPVVAAITLLTKLQNDVRYAEGEALSSILSGIDAGDVRVNELNAFVIPESRFVMRGSRYSAHIVLAAVDTTARPAIFVGGKLLENTSGTYEFVPGTSGSFSYDGYLEVPRGDGSMTRHEFSSDYVVMEPTATVSPTMMNVLYAGIENPLSISVPGVPQTNVSASMTGGSLKRTTNGWSALPTAPGTESVITVTAQMDGRSQTVASMNFRVRRLPDPTAYISLGDDARYKGGKPVAKAQLLASKGIGAAIDDGILDINFRITGFETVFFDSMGNAMPEVSNGAAFSGRQIEQIRRLSRGKRFFISRIKAVGPDGTERLLSPVEVIVN